MRTKRPRKEALFAQIVSPDGAVEFRDVTSFVGPVKRFEKLEATCGMRATGEVVAFSLLKVTRRNAESFAAKGMSIPRRSLGILEKRAKETGAGLGDDGVLIESEFGNQRCRIVRSDSGGATVEPIDDEVVFKLPKEAVKVSVYMRNAALGRLVAIGFIGHPGRPGDFESIRRVACQAIDTLTQLSNFRVISNIKSVDIPAVLQVKYGHCFAGLKGDSANSSLREISRDSSGFHYQGVRGPLDALCYVIETSDLTFLSLFKLTNEQRKNLKDSPTALEESSQTSVESLLRLSRDESLVENGQMVIKFKKKTTQYAIQNDSGRIEIVGRTNDSEYEVKYVERMQVVFRWQSRLFGVSFEGQFETLGVKAQLQDLASQVLQEAIRVPEFQQFSNIRSVSRPLSLLEIVFQAIGKASEERGHVLVFLPGKIEILKTKQQILSRDKRFENRIDILTGMSTPSERSQIAKTPYDPDQGPRVILATNVAESSVTLGFVVCVVDSGLRNRKVQTLNSEKGRGAFKLVPCQISKAEVGQRKGRVGRVKKGYYFPVFSQSTFDEMDDYPPSEMLQLGDNQLRAVVLQCLASGIRPDVLKQDRAYLMDPAELGKRVGAAIEYLTIEDAVTDEGLVTNLGLLSARMGVLPKVARLARLGDYCNVLPETALLAGVFAAGWEIREGFEPTSLCYVQVLARMYRIQSFGQDEAIARAEELADLAQTLGPRAFKQPDTLSRALEISNKIKGEFSSRVPTERLREVNPQLFSRAEKLVELWIENPNIHQWDVLRELRNHAVGHSAGAEEQPIWQLRARPGSEWELVDGSLRRDRRAEASRSRRSDDSSVENLLEVIDNDGESDTEELKSAAMLQLARLLPDDSPCLWAAAVRNSLLDGVAEKAREIRQRFEGHEIFPLDIVADAEEGQTEFSLKDDKGKPKLVSRVWNVEDVLQNLEQSGNFELGFYIKTTLKSDWCVIKNDQVEVRITATGSHALVPLWLVFPWSPPFDNDILGIRLPRNMTKNLHFTLLALGDRKLPVHLGFDLGVGEPTRDDWQRGIRDILGNQNVQSSDEANEQLKELTSEFATRQRGVMEGSKNFSDEASTTETVLIRTHDGVFSIRRPTPNN